MIVNNVSYSDRLIIYCSIVRNERTADLHYKVQYAEICKIKLPFSGHRGLVDFCMTQDSEELFESEGYLDQVEQFVL